MGSAGAMFLWAWILLDWGGAGGSGGGSGSGSGSLPEITDRNFISQCVREHNVARASVAPPASSMPTVTWDEDLARMARAWARRCRFEHSPDASRARASLPPAGENIWAGSPPAVFTVPRAVERWVAEKQQYSYWSNSCSRVCGHYTQVVWADSRRLGCAAQRCPRGVAKTEFSTEDGVVFVCNYAPAGNINGRRPYDPVASEGACVDDLCYSSYAVDGSNYVPILVVRPLGVILTFIAAYAVHHFYPDAFCYE